MKSSSTRLPNPALAAEKLLSRGAVCAPPVDLSKLISLWPNLFLTEEDLENEGYLIPIGELGAEILVKRLDKEERKRFTIAHELGHWVLGLALQKKAGHFSQPKNAHHYEIERWCDEFATNLLMPEPMIRASISPNDPVLIFDSLTRAASRFKVSDEALFIRVWEVLRIQVVILSLSTVLADKEALIERSFADQQASATLEKALERPEVIEQLQMSPLIYFSLSTNIGRVKCFGRRLPMDRIFLILKWPDLATESQES